MDGNTDKHTAHCTSCGCKMDITALAPYTNVVCPHCEHHTRVKCELGPYLLTSRHAAGGMSMVFAARDTTLQREVAVKILNANYSQDEVRMKQFEHEAQITAAISHPHVVKVFTVGHEYGQFYIAMEMVPGENLEQRMSREGALSEEVILPIAAEIISGLSAAQQAGLIHRDVKPGNILFDSADHAKIVDFGLSLVTQGGKAKADEIWATPYYVPPEALDGLEEDFRSDIYALGATLYHALSGKPPISEESKSTKSVRLAKNSIPPLAQTAPWLKPETCYLVDKAMAINAEERFSSYSEMSEAWQAAHLAVQNKNAATPIRSQQRAQRRSRKKLSGLASLIVCAVVALGLIGAAVMVFLNKDQSVETPPPPVEDRDFNNPADNEDDAYSPEVLAKIAKNQRRAHALIKKKLYPQAINSFHTIMEDPEVKEPTASWAGVEATIVSSLRDHGNEQPSLAKLKQHISAKGDVKDARIQEVVRIFENPGIIRQVKAGDDPLSVIPLTAAAIKNWELGAWDIATSQFQQVTQHPLPKESPLMAYKQLAANFISDHNQLKPFLHIELPQSQEETDQLLARLRPLLNQLQTARQGGRTRFYIRTWQLRLTRHSRHLRKLAAIADAERNRPPTYTEVLPQFHKLIASADFAKASTLLTKADTDKSEKSESDTWIYFTDSASAFIGDLTDTINKKATKAKIQTIEGTIYTSVISANADGLLLANKDGQQQVAWKNIDPESILTLHSAVFKHKLSTLEGQLGTEQAVCYAWLTGQREKAKIAAAKLSSVSNNFKKRWADAMRIQQDAP